MTATVLLVEDERKLRDLVRSYLERAGFTVLSTGSGAEAIDLGSSAAPDLVILDLGLPDVPGETVARELRATRPVPILMLTAKAAEEDRIAGLELGADDYVTKPFSPRELVLRVQAVLRRGSPAAGLGAASYGGGVMVIDEPRREVTVRDARVELTPTEWGILELLVHNAGKLVPQRQVLHDVWGPQYEDQTHYLRVYLAQLRRKLEPDPSHPRYLITEPGLGYRFVADAGG